MVAYLSYWNYEAYKNELTKDVAYQINAIGLRSSTILHKVVDGSLDSMATQEFLDSSLLANNAVRSISISLDDGIVNYSTDRKRIGTLLMLDEIKRDLDKHPEYNQTDHMIQEVAYQKNNEILKAFIVFEIKEDYLKNKITSKTIDMLYITIMLSGTVFVLFLLVFMILIAKPIGIISSSLTNTDLTECESECEQNLFELNNLRVGIVNSFKRFQQQSNDMSKLNIELEKRVSDEVVKSRQKDYLLIQQSKLATMGEMINAIAHQWRQPLNTLGLTIQDIKYAFSKNQIDESYIGAIIKDAMRQIKYMSKTIDDFRNFYKPTKEKKMFSLNKALVDSLSLVRARLEAHFFQINENYDDDLPEIVGYENEFKQALLNIITNSQDAADERGINYPAISVKTGKKDGYALLEIEDNCGGIPLDIIDRIFEPYYTTKEQGKGTGVGLYMSKTIIEENMSGYLEVSNTKDGARFTIRLPVI